MSLNPEVHFEGKVAQKAVITRGNTVLVIRDPREEKVIWEIPGGRLNVGEEPKAGLAREIEEELGVQCEIGEVIHIAQFLQGTEQKNALMIAYLATIPTDAEINPAEHEICEVKWIDEAEFCQLTFFPEYTDTLKIYFQKLKG